MDLTTCDPEVRAALYDELSRAGAQDRHHERLARLRGMKG